jgi:hypothetical protein
LPFPFSKRIGGAKKWKKRKGKFLVLRVRYNTPKRLVNKFISHEISLLVFPCFTNLALTPLLHCQRYALANYYCACSKNHPARASGTPLAVNNYKTLFGVHTEKAPQRSGF